MDSDIEQLKTPRHVVPSLLEVSSGSSLHKLSGSEPTADDRALPLCSITAVAAECHAAHVPAVKRVYANVNVHKSNASRLCLCTMHLTRPMHHTSWQEETN